MDILSSETQPPRQTNRVKNILTRHCGGKKVRKESLRDKNYLHPENAYLVKYFPKYYQSLAIVMKLQHSLLLKIKRIKKLKRFWGNFNEKIPKVDWFKILGTTRKEIEEFPKACFRPVDRFFGAKTSLHTVKFFFQITKLRVPTFDSWDSLLPKSNYREFLLIWETFSKRLKNMRRLRNLKVDVDYSESDALKPLVKKLNEMPRLLGQLQVLKASFRSSSDFLQNKSFCSHLTNLSSKVTPTSQALSSEIPPILQTISEICKNLKSLSLILGEDVPVHSQYLDFTTPMQEFPKLQSISICWPRSFSKNLWLSFIPPLSLRNLEITFSVAFDLVGFKKSIKPKNLCDHWKEIKQIDTLNLTISFPADNKMRFLKNFVTAMLQKISRLASFEAFIYLKQDKIWTYKPFDLKKVSHLYEHLKKFKVRFYFEDEEGYVGFDFDFFRLFKNLKKINFWAGSCSFKNIGHAIDVLEENMRNGGFLTLKIGEVEIQNPEELNHLLREISEAKKSGTHLRIKLVLKFEVEEKDDNFLEYLDYLDQFCEIIESKTVRGLEIVLYTNSLDCTQKMVEEVKTVLEKHPRMRNFTLDIFDIPGYTLEYIKKDGEKEQLLYYK